MVINQTGSALPDVAVTIKNRGALSGVHVEKLRVDPGKWQRLE
jgi:hypothetical protein